MTTLTLRRIKGDLSGHGASPVQDAPRGQGLVRDALPWLADQGVRRPG
jgi:hypothetical protein